MTTTSLGFGGICRFNWWIIRKHLIMDLVDGGWLTPPCQLITTRFPQDTRLVSSSSLLPFTSLRIRLPWLLRDTLSWTGGVRGGGEGDVNLGNGDCCVEDSVREAHYVLDVASSACLGVLEAFFALRILYENLV
ncbi:unnamed protein product [Eruca vesicaria subsp. sativa]|uniref:Uncharacterized protein n=1 Tax=Eruca vesicaria subsp. sativa TaxID=29727 RepID=A0ABC8M2D5_ERUVS|nr:unnamed protein product [Eruca vesicaria subsp. sativa]